MISRFIGLAFISLGLGMVLHNLIRTSPIFVPASITIMLIAIVLLGAVFGISLLMSNQLIERGMNPLMLVIASGIGLVFLLIGTVIAWVN
ncbi:hypothetical protein ACE1CA_00305 [Aerosakkonemataceae cyanobacterium BLCC-F167]|uniref:Uncharacterized protein n=2 Tax=Floridanema TaxID=3396149 RepID=A0ABV4WDJ7_9CYAN